MKRSHKFVFGFGSLFFLVCLASLMIPGEYETFFQNWKSTSAFVLDLLKFFGVLGAAIFAYVRWDDEQRWKRRSAVLDRVKAFRDTPGAYNAQLMMQGRIVQVPLWDRTVGPTPYVRITPDEVAVALTPETSAWPENDTHDAIRNSFNDLLSRLADIELYVTQARVLTDMDVWHLSERFHRDLERLLARAPQTGLALWDYICEYHAVVAIFLRRAEKAATGAPRLEKRPKIREIVLQAKTALLTCPTPCSRNKDKADRAEPPPASPPVPRIVIEGEIRIRS